MRDNTYTRPTLCRTDKECNSSWEQKKIFESCFFAATVVYLESISTLLDMAELVRALLKY